MRIQVSQLLASVSVLLLSASAFAQDQTTPSANPMSPGSPDLFTDYTASVAIYMLAVGLLVAILLIGAFMAINLGFLSKPARDRIGGRTPSDLGVLKDSMWPESGDNNRYFPAEEDEGFVASEEQETSTDRPPPSVAEAEARGKLRTPAPGELLHPSARTEATEPKDGGRKKVA